MDLARTVCDPVDRRLSGYYLGAQIGFALQSPNAPQSVLWLPNSILLAVLLIVPFRRWPGYLAAAFPAQMLVAVGTGAPPLTLGLLFLTNCADASLGAFLVRRVTRSNGPFKFDGLTATATFVVFGTILPTILLSFADAGISVATGWSNNYYAAFETRARSNILTHLIVVPAIVDLVVLDWRRLRGPRVAEGAALMVLLLVTCGVAFSRSAGSPAFAAVLYTPLPLLLWAAFRFGPGGIGWAALLVSMVASWNVLRGRGPFSSRSPLEEVVSLQLFLLATTLPLLCLSAVIRERDRVTRAIRASESALRNSYARVRELAGKLITAQEMERSRIARDLHDDLNQQLAALSFSISAIRRRSPDTSDLNDALRDLQQRTAGVIGQVRDVAHDLHPGTLDHAALIPALRTYCADFARQQGLVVRFTADDRSPVRDVAVCLYASCGRTAKHRQSRRGARRQRVAGRQARRLTIVAAAVADRTQEARLGLGLLSIEERARLVGGTVIHVVARWDHLHLQVLAR